MGDNYWGTTDTTVLHASIYDYRDNINVNGKVDFDVVLPAPVIGCPGLTNPCPTANFSHVILSDELFIVDSTDADSTFTRIWSFGDGNMDTTTGGSVYHVYSTLDTFYVWLHVYSPTGTLCDSMMVTVIASGSYFVEPSFTQAIDTNIAYNIFVVDESENVTASTTYSWDFGDGQSSSDRLPSHHYANFGKYALCLTLTDSGQTKTFCDSIGMNESGDVLKADGFTINVIKLASEPQRIEPQVLNVFPNPTKGNVSVYFNAPRSANYTVSLVSLLGETIALETNNLHAGKQHLKLDLTNYKTGIYYLRVQSESVNYSTRVSLIK
jgi:PKD repeat protein